LVPGELSGGGIGGPAWQPLPVAADEISVVPYAAVLDEATMPPGTRADGHPDSETRSHPFTHVLDEELLVGREPLRLKARLHRDLPATVVPESLGDKLSRDR